MNKMIAFFLVILAFTLQSNLYAQKENYNWYFGDYCGLTFMPDGKNPVVKTDGQLNTWEGCATISDSSGKLLFYTDGGTVWNKNHFAMINGTGLKGDVSASQSALIVPKPGSNNLYYIFTVDAETGPDGLNYSVVDMNKQSGLGEVIEKNHFLYTPVVEKLCGTKQSNGIDFWVIAHAWDSDKFLSYQLTSAGVNPVPVESHAGDIQQGAGYSVAPGYLKVSSDGKKLAQAVYITGYFELFDFDDVSGKVSNVIKLSNYDRAYGVEFSPDCSKLYGTLSWGTYGIVQFDLKAGSNSDIINSAKIICSNTIQCGLQLGPDNKIYVSKWQNEYLGVINLPDSTGTACNYVDDAIYLDGRITQEGLQNIVINHKSGSKDTCKNHPFAFNDFTKIQPIMTVGNAYQKDSFIRLTDVSRNRTGAVWFPYKLPVEKGFSVTFDFRISHGNNYDSPDNSLPGADGLAFVIQNNKSDAIGYNGGAIGYEGIPNSIALEFDTYNNDSTQIENYFDPNGNHAAIQSMGTKPNTSKHLTESMIAMAKDIMTIKTDSTIYHVKIDYNIIPGQFDVYLETTLLFGNPIISLSNFDPAKIINLTNGESAFIGFTSATGNATENHDILNWNICLFSDFILTDTENDKGTGSEYYTNTYPNPAGNLLIIDCPANDLKNFSITIINNLGIPVYNKILNNNGNSRFEINTTEFPAGVYYYTLKSGEFMVSNKFVIIR